MTYNPITWRTGAETAAATQIRLGANGELERVLPQEALYAMLWAHYLNNGLYDDLRLMGLYTGDQRLKALRNPAGRVVEFYAATVWPGQLHKAIPIMAENQAILQRIDRIWTWSNWSQVRQLQVRLAAITGDAFLKVAQPADGSARVFLQVIDPGHVSGLEKDERGYITAARVDVPQGLDEAGRPSWPSRSCSC